MSNSIDKLGNPLVSDCCVSLDFITYPKSARQSTVHVKYLFHLLRSEATNVIVLHRETLLDLNNSDGLELHIILKSIFTHFNRQTCFSSVYILFEKNIRFFLYKRFEEVGIHEVIINSFLYSIIAIKNTRQLSGIMLLILRRHLVAFSIFCVLLTVYSIRLGRQLNNSINSLTK